ncbi:helix-turn-helix domain-containing protein [Aphanothece sacrum]|uniref:XRE family transcriptional regulator n=1 Tax=Aphanothece sacrum FPU1 TaxID=1920663 RepID=A0A401IES1_APHSA|nr:helix-turn-helix transcriptional regulator [Aphanothece sacrum]GBF79680.1 XRE family transcriptional regulator [Aphanothece sacrum FPU1]GBF87140.1 transcriptional Regulator, XRE family [Aphanothece sacrum FPU3]
MTQVSQLHQQWLEDPEYKTAYEGMALEFEIASAIISARTQAGLTQAELAQRMSAKQSQIARWEGGEQNATIKTLMRIAEATGTHLKISFEKSN